MHFIYIDDSTDRPANVFCGLAIPHRQWNIAFEYIKKWRIHLRDTHGIPLGAEIHSTSFLSGRGSAGTLSHLSRHRRAQIFHKYFEVVEFMSRWDVRVFSVCNTDDDQYRSFERLLNRINRTMLAWDSFAHLICDEGKERQYTAMVRRMRVHNPIPSNQGQWPNGGVIKNIPIERIIEDPQFKNSNKSYFIQTSDILAFGLLRREFPTPKARQQRIHKSFEQLNTTLTRECSRSDPLGIIR